MGIGDQFAGLPMENLIGGPLSAAAKANKEMAAITADFINTVGFDKDGKLRTAAFMYEKRTANEDGTMSSDELKVNVPMLAIMPIPNLQVDEVNVMFDMEVKQSEKSESAMDMSASATGTLNLGIVKVTVTGSVSSHSTNTRSSDNSAKYHVDVRAANHGIPEGLARVLDMMAASLSPTLVSSTPKDANGQDLPAAAKARAEKIKGLRAETLQLENQLSAAKRSLDSTLMQMKKTGSSQQKVFQMKLTQAINGLDLDNADAAVKKKNEEQHEVYSKAMDEVNMSWNEFQSGISDNVKTIAAGGQAEKGLSKVFALKGLDDKLNVVTYTTGDYYNTLEANQKTAMEAQKNVDELEKDLLAKNAEYNNAISNRETPKIEEKTPAK